MLSQIIPTNESEKQVVEYLETYEDIIISTRIRKAKPCFRLKPQGDNTIIEKSAINLLEIHIFDGNLYLFGGISEKFYDSIIIYFNQFIDED